MDKFLPYAMVSLIMELNSIFLHWRSLNNLVGYDWNKPICRAVRAVNISLLKKKEFSIFLLLQ